MLQAQGMLGVYDPHAFARLMDVLGRLASDPASFASLDFSRAL